MTATMSGVGAAPHGIPVEWRSAPVADVKYAERVIEVVAAPYNEETVVEYRGRMVTESILPGAFDGIEKRVPPLAPEDRAVTVNVGHDYDRTIGIARQFFPSRTEGLVAELHIPQTVAGDEALELASVGAYGASVGMAVRQTDQRWSDGNRRRQIVRAFLDHIALVATPAYVGARALAVRSSGPQPPSDEELWTPPATPRVDEALAYASEVAALLARVRA